MEIALNKAVENNDLNKFLSIKDELEAVSLTGLQKIARKRQQTQEFKEMQRKEIAKKVQCELGPFDDVQSMNKALNELYGPFLNDLQIYPLKKGTSGLRLRGLCLDNIEVKSEFRRLGIHSHIRKTLFRFADEHNYIVTETPTDQGDGSMKADQKGFREHAILHKAQLEKSLLKAGYEYNYAFDHFYETDALTGEEYPHNEGWIEQFRPEAIKILEGSGSYVRWPKNQIPEEWKRVAF